jgi:PiT family inorganic phosphate transporter
MILFILFIATLFVAYSNGANDNFKGVATLFGSKTTNYRRAIWWATVTTFAGSVCSIFLAQGLVAKFSGRGLVPNALVNAPEFLLAVAVGAGLTVILATLTGFPVSTTHGLTGALIGAGLTAVGAQVSFSALGKSFFLPLLISPVLAVLVAVVAYVLARGIRLKSGVSKEWCVCVGEMEQCVPITEPASFFSVATIPLPSIMLATRENCTQRYKGKMLGLSVQSIIDVAHFISAGAVSFARGLNDTPKIVALLLLIQAFGIRAGMFAVAIGMAVGGLLNAKRVALTMSKKITPMNHGQGFTANFVTAILVIFASRFALPVSTTHVSVGSLFGIGLMTRQANMKVVSQIVMSWLLTLPIAGVLSAIIYWVILHASK